MVLGRRLAAEILERPDPPGLLLFIGNLGSGKTTLAKGLISGLGAATADEVTSPTFTLVHQFGRDPKVFHVDLYRVEPGRDLETLGLEDLWNQDAGGRVVVLVEWGEKLGGIFTGLRWEFHLNDLGGDRRQIILEDR